MITAVPLKQTEKKVGKPRFLRNIIVIKPIVGIIIIISKDIQGIFNVIHSRE
jgi:hypothetical protein